MIVFMPDQDRNLLAVLEDAEELLVTFVSWPVRSFQTKNNAKQLI